MRVVQIRVGGTRWIDKKTPAMTQLIEKFVSYISYLDYAANNHLTERVRIKYFLNKFIVVFILLYLNL